MENPNLDYFLRRWAERKKPAALSGRELWNKKSDSWVRNFDRPNGESKNRRRLASVAAHLRQWGQLRPIHRVVDIGCGPGFYVTEFARTAGHVLGVDISDRMLDYAQAHARQEGVENVSWQIADFPGQVDIAALGWEKSFDLVFTSTTPAFAGPEALRQVHRMSRGYCFHTGWISRSNSLISELTRRLRGEAPEAGEPGESTYALFNILWLMGCQPAINYYREESEDLVAVTPERVEYYAERVLGASDAEAGAAVRKELGKMAAEGDLRERLEAVFAWTLWRTPGE
ncbi:MAG: class I SAM-dependent methyltransferase [Gracilibacteraceae bacterium]|jgi:SAM-dependent methyltransferase|nr:class I SAM-dependent methyltransferase [Gracilibacteraceae bacterium]